MASLSYLTGAPGGGIVAAGTLDGLRFEADDIDWSQGRGPVVRGSAEALLLAVTGRRAALADLGGEGVPTLRDRLGSTS